MSPRGLFFVFPNIWISRKGNGTYSFSRVLLLWDMSTLRPQIDFGLCVSSSLTLSLCVSSSKRLVTLARGLSPAFLRFGGKRTDFLQFNNQKNLAKFRGPGPDYYLKNYEDGDYRRRFFFLAASTCNFGRCLRATGVWSSLVRDAQSQLYILAEVCVVQAVCFTQRPFPCNTGSGQFIRDTELNL